MKNLPTTETIPPKTQIGLGPCLVVTVATRGAKNHPKAHETTIAQTGIKGNTCAQNHFSLMHTQLKVVEGDSIENLIQNIVVQLFLSSLLDFSLHFHFAINTFVFPFYGHKYSGGHRKCTSALASSSISSADKGRSIKIIHEIKKFWKDELKRSRPRTTRSDENSYNIRIKKGCTN